MTVNRSADCRRPRTPAPRYLFCLRSGVWLCVVMAGGLLLARPADFLSPAMADDDAGNWRAGVAVAVITPAKSMMLAGFGSRTKPSEGTATELHAKALALKDSRGTRLVIVTTDLIRIPRPLRDRVEARVKELSLIHI